MVKFHYNKEIVKEHVSEMFEYITHVDKEKYRYWYEEASEWCRNFAKQYKLKHMPVMGVTAGLSPQCSWKQNKLFVEAYYNGIEKHYKSQIAKCNRIDANYCYLGITDYNTNKKQIISYLGGKKTQSFFQNILEPKKSKVVTIDRHMLIIAGISNKSLTVKQYNFLENIFQELANESNLLPLQYQAILWGFYRQENNLEEKYG